MCPERGNGFGEHVKCKIVSSSDLIAFLPMGRLVCPTSVLKKALEEKQCEKCRGDKKSLNENHPQFNAIHIYGAFNIFLTFA